MRKELLVLAHAAAWRLRVRELGARMSGDYSLHRVLAAMARDVDIELNVEEISAVYELAWALYKERWIG